MKKILFIVIVIALLGSIYIYTKAPKQTEVLNKPEENISELTVKMDQAISTFGVTVKPSKIVEDSRCPKDVQCIQAGRLRVEVQIGSTLGATSRVFEIGQSEVYDGHKITLKSALPISKQSTVELKPSDYSFTFLIEPTQ